MDLSTVLHFLISDFTLQAYQCDVCDFDKLQETFKRIESDFQEHICGVIAVRLCIIWSIPS